MMEKMSTVNEKAAAFISRLLQNPSLNQLTPLQREEQILQFFAINARQLVPTLASPGFFPGKNWEQIMAIMYAALRAEIDGQLMPGLEQIVNEQIDYSFIQFLRQQNMPQQRVKDDILQFLSSLLQKQEIRREFTGVYSAIAYNYVDRYIDQAFERKQYVHFELTKVQRLKMGKEEIKNFIRATLLLKPAIHLLSASESESSNDVTGGTVQLQFIEKVSSVLKEKLTILPEQLVRSGLYSNGSFFENRAMDATSRISSIFGSMCRNHRPGMQVDRGADTADKSWINIARRNYKFYGFDVKLLDEFYKIAAENGW